MSSRLLFFFVVIFLSILSTEAETGTATSSSTSRALLGVNPKDAPLYSGKTFKCPGSNKIIPIEQVNDDYCDCPYIEGVTITDEPGTGACRNGVFYCANRKFRPKTLPASRVNDGACDCCDGSDEWKALGGVACPSDCAALGEKVLGEEKTRLEDLGNALQAKRDFVAKAQKDLEELRSELHRLKSPQQKQQQQQQQEEDDVNVKLPAPDEVLPVVNIKLGTDDIPDEDLNKISLYTEEEEEEGEKEVKEEEEAVKKEEEKIFDEETVEEDIPPEDFVEPINDIEEKESGSDSDSDKDNNNDDDSFSFSDSDNDSGSDDDDDDDKLTLLRIMAREIKKAEKTVKKAMKKFVFGKPGKLPSLTERIKWPFRYAYAKVVSIVQGKPMPKGINKYRLGPKPKKEAVELERKNKERAKEIEKLLAMDFGEDSCFYSIYNNCTAVKRGEYNYEVCPFKSGSQSGTLLGNWDAWKKQDDAKTPYVMLYKKGNRCFNGVDRSLTVIVECGPEYKALDASEPAMCEYQMRIASPCACSQAEYDALLKNIQELEEEMKD